MPELPQQFTLTIELGNSAMQTPEDVAAALHELSQTLPFVIMTDWAKRVGGTIVDINGNSVGKWEVK